MIDPKDSFEAHIQDTLRVGAGLCRGSIVDMVVREGPGCIQDLIAYGVDFTREGRGSRLRERAVTRRTESSISTISPARRSNGSPRTCPRAPQDPRRGKPDGRRTRHREARQKRGRVPRCLRRVRPRCGERHIDAIAAKRTILATGGAGKVYIYTSNPDVATGDGIAIAYRAGARVANLEFVQFHPTWLYHPMAKSFLLTETLRGEGGVLRRPDGYAFMKDYHQDRDLGPRDVVARAIDREMKSSGSKCVYLDMTHMGREDLKTRFPYIYSSCMEVGIDMAVEPIPVVPATHYFCGGVDVDEWGRTSLANLFALGEVSHTGVHGATASRAIRFSRPWCSPGVPPALSAMTALSTARASRNRRRGTNSTRNR